MDYQKYYTKGYVKEYAFKPKKYIFNPFTSTVLHRNRWIPRFGINTYDLKIVKQFQNKFYDVYKYLDGTHSKYYFCIKLFNDESWIYNFLDTYKDEKCWNHIPLPRQYNKNGKYEYGSGNLGNLFDKYDRTNLTEVIKARWKQFNHRNEIYHITTKYIADVVYRHNELTNIEVELIDELLNYGYKSDDEELMKKISLNLFNESKCSYSLPTHSLCYGPIDILDYIDDDVKNYDDEVSEREGYCNMWKEHPDFYYIYWIKELLFLILYPILIILSLSLFWWLPAFIITAITKEWWTFWPTFWLIFAFTSPVTFPLNLIFTSFVSVKSLYYMFWPKDKPHVISKGNFEDILKVIKNGTVLGLITSSIFKKFNK